MRKYNDVEFRKIVDDILENDEFKKLKYIGHHGITRYIHCVGVAYYTYMITKLLRLNYIEATRAALLHDFFTDEVITENGIGKLRRHPNYALSNAKKYFSLSSLQEDIIKCHMFPVTFTPPKYLESWIVDITDDVIAVYERCFAARKRLSATSSLLLLVILDFIGVR